MCAGLISKYPITVIARHVAGMTRGFLVVRVRGVVYVVLHLHAQDSVLRDVEAKLVIRTLGQEVPAGTPVVIMGDFNTLSHLDEDCYWAENLMDYLFDPRVNPRFQRKYLSSDANHHPIRSFNFNPMLEFLFG